MNNKALGDLHAIIKSISTKDRYRLMLSLIGGDHLGKMLERKFN